MTTRAAKRLLRREIVARIVALPREDRDRQEAQLLAEFGTMPGFAKARTVLLYASAFPEEIDTRPFLALALETGKRLILPRVNVGARRLELVEVADAVGSLVPGKFDIPEPRASAQAVDPGEIDWVLVPGLAFDATGARLGRGGGYYDRLLPLLRADCPRWAMIYDEQWVDRVPVVAHDARVDGIASPGRGSCELSTLI
jgi:5-formyltetrahydrofolate cyclo-ligase